MRSTWQTFEIFKAPQGVHHLLSACFPLFHAVVIWWLFTGAFPSFLEILVWLIFGLGVSLWSAAGRFRHGQVWRRIWSLTVLHLGTYVALTLLDPVGWDEKLRFWGRHAILFGFAVFSGAMTISWQSQLTPRARLFQVTAGVQEGPALVNRVRNFQEDADFSAINYATLVLSCQSMTLLTFVLSLLLFSRRPAAAIVVAPLSLLIGWGILPVLGLFRREMETFVYGKRWSLRQKMVTLARSWGLLLAAACIAFAVTNWLGPLVDWSRVSFPAPPKMLLEPPPRIDPPPFQPDFSDVGAVNPLQVLIFLLFLLLLESLRHLFELVFVLYLIFLKALPWLFLTFLAWPLIEYLRGKGRGEGLGAYWWRRLRTQILLAWGGLRRVLRSRNQKTDGRRRVSDVRELGLVWARTNPLRRRRLVELAEAFLGVVAWAEAHPDLGSGFAYRNGETTRAYLTRLARAAAPVAPALEGLAEAIDRELFSPIALNRREWVLLRRNVKLVVDFSGSFR